MTSPERTRAQQLRVPTAFDVPLNTQAMAQLLGTLARQPQSTIAEVSSHLHASVAQDQVFMQRLRDLIALETVHHDLRSKPDPHMPVAEREAIAKEAVMKKVVDAIRTGRLAVSDEARAGALQIVRQSLGQCIQVVDEADQELKD